MDRISKLFTAFDCLREPWKLLSLIAFVLHALILLQLAGPTRDLPFLLGGYGWLCLVIVLHIASNRHRLRAADEERKTKRE